MFVSIAEFERAPLGRIVRGADYQVWCVDASLCVSSVWGRPTADGVFDLQRCRDVVRNLVPAVVRIDIDPADAARIAALAKGEIVAVLLERASVKRTGNAWNLGRGRAIWTGKPLPIRLK